MLKKGEFVSRVVDLPLSSDLGQKHSAHVRGLSNVPRVCRGAFATLSLAVVLVVGAACGGDGGDARDPLATGSQALPVGNESTAVPASSTGLEEYFHDLDEAFVQLREDLLNNAVPDASELTSIEDIITLLQDSLGGLEQSISDFVDEIEGLETPDEVADAHQALVVALRSDRQAVSELAEEFREAETVNDAMAALQSRSGLLLQSREPCRRLQQIAQEHSISSDLACEE